MKKKCEGSYYVCVGFFYTEYLSVSYECFGNCTKWQITSIYTVKPHADILILGDFNIDLLKPHSSWNSTITLLGLTKLVKSPTRITQTSATLIDHIYTNDPDVITEVRVPDLSITDHCPISCSRSIKLPKYAPKSHSYISFRILKHFNKTAFCNDRTGPSSLKSWTVLIPIKPWRHGTMYVSLLWIDMHL